MCINKYINKYRTYMKICFIYVNFICIALNHRLSQRNVDIVLTAVYFIYQQTNRQLLNRYSKTFIAMALGLQTLGILSF